MSADGAWFDKQVKCPTNILIVKFIVKQKGKCVTKWDGWIIKTTDNVVIAFYVFHSKYYIVVNDI